MARNYRELDAWQAGMSLVELVYAVSKAWPREELYGLQSQVRREAVSVPSNIAEGEDRGSDIDFARFLDMAHGSVREVETQLLISVRIKYSEPEHIVIAMEKCGETGRLINGLIRYLRNSKP